MDKTIASISFTVPVAAKIFLASSIGTSVLHLQTRYLICLSFTNYHCLLIHEIIPNLFFRPTSSQHFTFSCNCFNSRQPPTNSTLVTYYVPAFFSRVEINHHSAKALNVMCKWSSSPLSYKKPSVDDAHVPRQCISP